MLVTKQLDSTPSGGRELLCKLNYDALKAIYGDRLILFELPRSRRWGLLSVTSTLGGHIDGLNKSVIAKALEAIQSENIGKVFVDGSNLGGLVKIIKQTSPQVEISTFFHNVETRFFLGALGQFGTLRALAVLVANYLAERKAVRYSDKIVCLSERDGRLLRTLYGRGATHVSPMAVQDTRPAGVARPTTTSPERFALFVGGSFYANRAGISWFVENVVPRVGIKTCIVGRGLDDLKPKLEREGKGKVSVIGAVDSLSDWYQDAHFVIAPIFDGSGMKTKVAEALMYGKKIIGTPEAFSGYENIADRAGWVCATADDFVEAIGRANVEITKSFDPELRALYEQRYSYLAARSRLAAILG